MQALSKIPAPVARKLGYYVYLYVNPLDHSIFYVGKGKGGRALAHLDDVEKRNVAKTIRLIRSAGAEPEIEILAHALPSAEVALQVEAAVIDALGIAGLGNVVRGWRGAKFGRVPLSEIVAQYTRKRACIKEPSILIRIPQIYSCAMNDSELYDATRSSWVIGDRREAAQYAFAVFEGVVRQVYKITMWLPGGSTFNTRWPDKPLLEKGRWEFVGVIAEPELRQRYINRYVGHLFTQGAQNPITYVNIE
jgi:hypothetical protein